MAKHGVAWNGRKFRSRLNRNTGRGAGRRTFFLRLAGREGEELSGRSEASSLRVESRLARWVRFEGLGMMTMGCRCLRTRGAEGDHAERAMMVQTWLDETRAKVNKKKCKGCDV